MKEINIYFYTNFAEFVLLHRAVSILEFAKKFLKLEYRTTLLYVFYFRKRSAIKPARFGFML